MSASETSASLRFRVVPFTGAPGSEDVARFVRDMLNAAGEKPDEFGYSASENMQGLDAGGAAAGAPPFDLPAGAGAAAELRKNKAGFMKRSKDSAAMVYQHVTDPNLRRVIFELAAARPRDASKSSVHTSTSTDLHA